MLQLMCSFIENMFLYMQGVGVNAHVDNELPHFVA